jgi:hypothetical protein
MTTDGKIVSEDDGLTLTGAVLKAMQEYGSPYVYRPLAEHIAKRIEGRVEWQMKRTSERIACQQEEIQRQQADIRRLRSMAIPDGMTYAETCLLRARMEAAEGEVVACRKQIACNDRDLTSANGFLRDQQKEIKHLQSALGTERGKALRLGGRIASQNEEIHRLNELLKAMRRAAGFSDQKSFASIAHPNCRCHHDSMNLPDDPWIAEGRIMVMGITEEAIESTQGSIVRALAKIDTRPYAVLCGHCGQVIMETDACCRHCGASNRPCVACQHFRKEPDESCTSADCNNNSRWEERI